MLALGIPGDAVTAALMGGLQIHGIEPGPLLGTMYPELIIGIFGYFLISTVCMFLLMILGGARLFPIILRAKKSYLLPMVLVTSLIGCYNIGYTITDVWVSFVFGIMGYFFSRHGYPLVPLVITLVLGGMFEKQVRTAMLMTDGEVMPFFHHPSLGDLSDPVGTVRFSGNQEQIKKQPHLGRRKAAYERGALRILLRHDSRTFRVRLPRNWHTSCDSILDNFCVISPERLRVPM